MTPIEVGLIALQTLDPVPTTVSIESIPGGFQCLGALAYPHAEDHAFTHARYCSRNGRSDDSWRIHLAYPVQPLTRR